MRIKKISIINKGTELSIDLQQEYDALKALHRIIGHDIKLKDLDKLTFTIYKDHINLYCKPLAVDKDVENDFLIRFFKIYPSTFTDFLYHNGAQNSNPAGIYRPYSKPAKKVPTKMQWVRNSKGFWVEVPVE